MERSQVIEYIRNPEQIGAADLVVLEQLTHTYPYCQTFQLLHAKCLHNQDNPRYSAQVKLAAAYAGNRGLLKQLIEKRKPVDESVLIEEVASEMELLLKSSIEEEVIEEVVEEIQLDAAEIKVEEIIKIAAITPEPTAPVSPEVPQRTKLIDIIRSRMADIPAEPETDISTPEHAVEPVFEIKALGIEPHSPNETTVSTGNITSDNNATLIDRFIREEPRLSPPRREFFNPVDMAKMSSMDRDDLVSETLARIFVQQGDIPKAIKIYERLCLNFPEKSSYFAAQIINLERNLK